VPYNLFKLFLGHKISAYKFIYENGKKKWEKEKENEFQVNRTRGILARSGAGARRRGQMGLDGPRGAGDDAADVVGAGPRAREGEGRRRHGGGGERSAAGENRSPVNPMVVPRRWSDSGWTGWCKSTSGGRGSRRWGQFDQWRAWGGRSTAGGGRSRR
jgi:hypothetical protein